ncbi:MAG: hypothetical protein Q7S27_01245 [Nanoarchaeota archaeon]|nr:hypothetical protein [Nanoarchaeota archaeon]
MIEIKKEGIILKPSNIKPTSTEFQVIATINPGAIRLPNNDILLYVRVIEKLIKDQDEKYYYAPRMTGEESFKLILDKFDKKKIAVKNPLDFVLKDETKRLTYISHFRRIILDKNGFKIKSIDKKPCFYGLAWDSELGVEDPRITKIGKLYLMTYVGLSRSANVSTYLAISKDCKKWYRRGIIFQEQNKDVVILPELINKNYIALNRPEGSFQFSQPHIWISYSNDLEKWGKSKPIELSKKGEWDSDRVGAGPPPIKTKEGWLLIYHGVKENTQRATTLMKKIKFLFGKREKRLSYDVGAALLEYNNPHKIIFKSKNPIILPIKKYEKGTFENKDVVFPTGLIEDLNKKDLLIYSGGGDIVTTVKKVSLKKILDTLE